MLKYKNYNRYHGVYDQLVVRRTARVRTLLKPYSFYSKIAAVYYASFFHTSYWYYRIFYKQLFRVSPLINDFNKSIISIKNYFYIFRGSRVCTLDNFKQKYYYHTFVRYRRFRWRNRFNRIHGGMYQQRISTRYQPRLKGRFEQCVRLSSAHKIKQFVALNSSSLIPFVFILALGYLGVIGMPIGINKIILKLFLGYQLIFFKQCSTLTMRALDLFFSVFYQSLRHWRVHQTHHLDVRGWKRLSGYDYLTVWQRGFLQRYYKRFYGKRTRWGFKRGLVANTNNVFRYYIAPYNIMVDLLEIDHCFYIRRSAVSPWIHQLFAFNFNDFIKYYTPIIWFFYYAGALSHPYFLWGNNRLYSRPNNLMHQWWFISFFIQFGLPERCVFWYRDRLRA